MMREKVPWLGGERRGKNEDSGRPDFWGGDPSRDQADKGQFPEGLAQGRNDSLGFLYGALPVSKR